MLSRVQVCKNLYWKCVGIQPMRNQNNTVSILADKVHISEAMGG